MMSNFKSALHPSLALLGGQPADDVVEPDSPFVPLYERQCQELSLSGSPVAALLLDRLCQARFPDAAFPQRRNDGLT